METKETMTLLNKTTQELETFNIHTGEMVARSGELISSHVYSLEISEAICNLIREGHTYARTSELLRVPLHLIYNWRSHYPDFNHKLGQARKDRGTYFHDKAVDVLEQADSIDREDVPGAKFKFDSFLKLAGISSPTEYAPQPKIAAVQAPATIIINTGITREPVTIDGESHGPEELNTATEERTFGEIPEGSVRREAEDTGAESTGTGSGSPEEVGCASGEQGSEESNEEKGK